MEKQKGLLPRMQMQNKHKGHKKRKTDRVKEERNKVNTKIIVGQNEEKTRIK